MARSLSAAIAVLALLLPSLPAVWLPSHGQPLALAQEAETAEEPQQPPLGEDAPPADAGAELPPAPPEAVPEPAQAAQPGPRSHDWRSPGFVSSIGGQLFDPDCVPLRSVGSNVPNLPFSTNRAGTAANLEWMRRHTMRWMRVFATGHGLGADLTPRDAASAIAALRFVLREVETFNAARPAHERIYVLVSLTDYYPPGVPGDVYAFDHPLFRSSPVLPAPWYRAGVRQFDFEQEHGLGRLTGLPNYEVNYKPWVRQVVAALADNPALLGWQLGNELKARNSPRNGITPDQAYGWYLDFTRDMVDTIRAHDRRHAIVMGTQYMAELVDYGYRTGGDTPAAGPSRPSPDLLPTYERLAGQALEACAGYCWNVWGLTDYDLNLYPLDDATVFHRHGVPSLMTEFGLTRSGTDAEQRARYGGDRPAVVRAGLERAWVDVTGQPQPRMWSVAEMAERAPLGGISAERAPLGGISPWNSPAPGVQGSELDIDTERGLTAAPDEAAMWAAWAEAGARLEAANRAAGPSPVCLAHVSSLTPLAPSASLDAALSSCPITATGGFGAVLAQDPSLAARLACAGRPEAGVQVVEQSFERGHMLWRGDTGRIWVSFQDGTWRSFADTYRQGESLAPVSVPPSLAAPERGFGKLWREQPELRERLGWATGPERAAQGAAQEFAGGAMVWTGPETRLIRAYVADGTTATAPDPT